MPYTKKARASLESLREPLKIFEDQNIAHFLAHVNPQKSYFIAVSAAWHLATKARQAYVAHYGLRLRSLAMGINAGRPYDYQVHPALFIRSQPGMSFMLSAVPRHEDIRQKVTRQIRGRPLTCPARSFPLIRSVSAALLSSEFVSSFRFHSFPCGKESCV